jgi:hypothetical protein
MRSGPHSTSMQCTLTACTPSTMIRVLIVSVIDTGSRNDISARAGLFRRGMQQFDCRWCCGGHIKMAAQAVAGAGEIEYRDACLLEEPMGDLKRELWRVTRSRGTLTPRTIGWETVQGAPRLSKAVASEHRAFTTSQSWPGPFSLSPINLHLRFAPSLPRACRLLQSFTAIHYHATQQPSLAITQSVLDTINFANPPLLSIESLCPC